MHEGHRERMRERLYEHGGSLTDHELLEIFLYEPIARRNTNPIAHRLLESFCDLNGVFSASPRLLEAVAGVGPQTAEYIWLMGECMRRMRGREREEISLYNYGMVESFVRARFEGCKAEKLELYLLDANNVLLCTKTITEVSKDRVTLDGKALGAVIAEVAPANVIVAHNHPSGSCEPSEEDDRCIRELSYICSVHGARLCDSVIVGKELYSYYHTGRIYAVREDG